MKHLIHILLLLSYMSMSFYFMLNFFLTVSFLMLVSFSPIVVLLCQFYKVGVGVGGSVEC